MNKIKKEVERYRKEMDLDTDFINGLTESIEQDKKMLYEYIILHGADYYEIINKVDLNAMTKEDAKELILYMLKYDDNEVYDIDLESLVINGKNIPLKHKEKTLKEKLEEYDSSIEVLLFDTKAFKEETTCGDKANYFSEIEMCLLALQEITT